MEITLPLVSGIPTLILLDAEGHMITRQGRVEVLNDPECRLFPWHPRPVLELSESNAVQLHEGPCLVLFVGESDTTKVNSRVSKKKTFPSIWCNRCKYRSNRVRTCAVSKPGCAPVRSKSPLLSSLPLESFFSPQVPSFSPLKVLLSPSDAEEEGELEPAKELIQPIAEKLMAKYKAKEEETPLLFFVAGEVR